MSGDNPFDPILEDRILPNSPHRYGHPFTPVSIEPGLRSVVLWREITGRSGALGSFRSCAGP